MDYTFETDIRVTYRDVDMQRVVHNSHYLQFAEIGRIEYLREKGMPYQEVTEKFNLEMVLVESHCVYKKPARFDDLLTVRVRIGDIGRSSFKVFYEITRNSTDDVIAEIRTHHVCVDRDSFKPVSIPEAVRSLFT
ncbi:MAG: acyl-CoA thioesterase [Candidatus Marinimicrobia bacterium]|nr:acyl-CoA thioesterase [Candidatus Neomarinimicrobiota bacterium]MCF7829761.1 acyl-CoA thioesterase [Candidatus Neomarinimicrobiota bacterium]MCF7881711.1 acyl-CoA thioesterase [Candidatus Neomarinimicrobiota bacterium]